MTSGMDWSAEAVRPFQYLVWAIVIGMKCTPEQMNGIGFLGRDCNRRRLEQVSSVVRIIGVVDFVHRSKF
jgi:hypothetical protein